MAKREVWERRVRRWQRSKLTAAQFASRDGVARGTLLWWSSKLQREAREASAMPFIEVTAVTQPTQPIEVALANGRLVRVPASFDDGALERVIIVAERA